MVAEQPTFPPKPKSPYPYGYVREDGMMFVGLRKSTDKKRPHWIEHWKNPETHRAYINRWIQRPDVKARRLAYAKRFMKTEGFKAWAKAQPWYAATNARKYKKYKTSPHGRAKIAANLARPEVKSARAQRRAARRIRESQANPLLNTVMAAIYETSRTYSQITGVKHHVDHVIPLSKGGLHVPWNLDPIPWYENLKKHNKVLENK